MSVAEKSVYEIRWHGRGGQGAVTSAKILADAAYRSGFAGVTSQPSFGAERRGAPITASTRLAHEPIRVLNQVTRARHRGRARRLAAAGRRRDHGRQAGRDADRQHHAARVRISVSPATSTVVTADVTGAAEAVDLIVGGQPMVSTAILGSFAAATGLIDLDSVEQAIGHVFTGKAASQEHRGGTNRLRVHALTVQDDRRRQMRQVNALTTHRKTKVTRTSRGLRGARGPAGRGLLRRGEPAGASEDQKAHARGGRQVLRRPGRPRPRRHEGHPLRPQDIAGIATATVPAGATKTEVAVEGRWARRSSSPSRRRS